MPGWLRRRKFLTHHPSKKQEIKGKWVAVVLTGASIGAWFFYYIQGLTLAYNDARSHLNIARRMVDSLQPGLAQIGSVWLPLYHLLELPLIWNDWLWHSGIAGSVVSMTAFVLGGWWLWKLLNELELDIYAQFAGLLIYGLNPNLLYMQATPMTESLLICLGLGTVYYLACWAKQERIIDLVTAGGLTFLSTLTRYDGWFLLLFSGLAVGYLAFKKYDRRVMEGQVLLFGTIAGLGVVIWLVWNWLIFNDPWYFVLGPFSAKSQQDVLLAEGRLYTKGNPLYAFIVYGLVVLKNMGWWVTILAVIGCIKMWTAKTQTSRVKLMTGLLLVPWVFNVGSLVMGHSVIHTPELPPYTWFNDRYGLMMLPAVAVMCAFLVDKRRLAAGMLIAVMVLQTGRMYLANEIITIEDGVRGTGGEFLDKSAGWVENNLADEEGLILVAASSNDALMFSSGLPMRRFITEGAQKYWQASLADPTRHAKWVIMHKGDLVHKSLIGNELFLNSYRLVYRDSFIHIYKLEPGAGSLLTASQLP